MPNKYLNKKQRKKARLRSDRIYKKKAQKAYCFRFHRINDADIIKKLNSVSNKQNYVRTLIENDIKTN